MSSKEQTLTTDRETQPEPQPAQPVQCSACRGGSRNPNTMRTVCCCLSTACIAIIVGGILVDKSATADPYRQTITCAEASGKNGVTVNELTTPAIGDTGAILDLVTTPKHHATVRLSVKGSGLISAYVTNANVETDVNRDPTNPTDIYIDFGPDHKGFDINESPATDSDDPNVVNPILVVTCSPDDQ